MNQEKIGKFIATMRKENKMTQSELGEKLGVTDKTISRWENSNYMPDVSVMKLLCKILGITINELLDGEKIAENETPVRAEEQIMILLQERQLNKRKVWQEIIITLVGILTLLGSILLASLIDFGDNNVLISVLVAVFGFIMCMSLFIVANMMEQGVGSYECIKCHKRFAPDIKTLTMSNQFLSRRHLKCPYCEKISWCKRKLNK